MSDPNDRQAIIVFVVAVIVLIVVFKFWREILQIALNIIGYAAIIGSFYVAYRVYQQLVHVQGEVPLVGIIGGVFPVVIGFWIASKIMRDVGGPGGSRSSLDKPIHEDPNFRLKDEYRESPSSSQTPRTKTCPECHGSTRTPCLSCGGSRNSCSGCGGSGYETCRTCFGAGTIPA